MQGQAGQKDNSKNGSVPCPCGKVAEQVWLYKHRAYKVNVPFRLISDQTITLVVIYTSAFCDSPSRD